MTFVLLSGVISGLQARFLFLYNICHVKGFHRINCA